VQLFFAAFFAGLGFFNKIDFAVLLIGSVIAGTFCYGRLLRRALRDNCHLLHSPVLVSLWLHRHPLQHARTPEVRTVRKSFQRTG